MTPIPPVRRVLAAGVVGVVGVAGLLALAGPAIEATAAPAATAASIGITPVGTTASYFTLTMSPGTSRQLAVELSNPTPVSAQASTYAADVYTIVNGGFGARPAGQATSGATNWLTYPTADIVLAPKRAERRSFTVTVPADATPGEHVTSLVVQDVQRSTDGQMSLAQIDRQALPLVIDVPGLVRAAISIGAASQAFVDGHTVISVAVSNAGNVRVRPVGQLTVTGNHGTPVAAQPVAMGTVYPGDTTAVRDTLGHVLAPAVYTVTLTLGDPKAHAPTRTATASVTVTAPSPQQIPRPAGYPQAVRPNAPASSENLVVLLAAVVVGSLLTGAAGTAVAVKLRRTRRSR